MDIYLAERYRCNSHILFQSSGVSFLFDVPRPGDYIAVVSESIHVGSIVQVRIHLFSDSISNDIIDSILQEKYYMHYRVTINLSIDAKGTVTAV